MTEPISPIQWKQMIAFYGSSALTVGAALVTKRSTLARKYVPNMFQANHRPAEFNMVKDALNAVGQATFLSISTFACAVSGTIWAMGVHSTKDFSDRMVKLLGGEKRRQALAEMPVSKDVKELEDGLNDLFKK